MRTWLYIFAICAWMGVQAHAWAHQNTENGEFGNSHSGFCLACKIGQNNPAPVSNPASIELQIHAHIWFEAATHAAPLVAAVLNYHSRAPPLPTDSLT